MISYIVILQSCGVSRSVSGAATKCHVVEPSRFSSRPYTRARVNGAVVQPLAYRSAVEKRPQTFVLVVVGVKVIFLVSRLSRLPLPASRTRASVTPSFDPRRKECFGKHTETLALTVVVLSSSEGSRRWTLAQGAAKQARKRDQSRIAV